MKQLNQEENKKFWKNNTEQFKGSIISELLINKTKSYIGKEILDVGAGDGSLAIKIKKRLGKSVISIDIAPKSGEVIEGSCTNLKFKDNSFNTLFCTDIIEHLNDEDLIKCLSEVHRVLKVGGYLIITTLNNEALENNIITCPKCENKFHRWGHGQSFLEERLRELLKKFEVIEFKKLNLVLLAKYPLLARVFYFFGFEKLFKINTLRRNDFLIVVRK